MKRCGTFNLVKCNECFSLMVDLNWDFFSVQKDTSQMNAYRLKEEAIIKAEVSE